MMNTSKQIAKLFRDVHFGDNWISVNLKDSLTAIDWQQAITKVYDLNTIAALVYHLNYYVAAVLNVLEGGPLEAHDKFSYDLPLIHTQEDWENLLTKTWADAEKFAGLVELIPDEKLFQDFTDKKYGSYYRNFHGIIEHIHYHLGQIVIIKKIIQEVE